MSDVSFMVGKVPVNIFCDIDTIEFNFSDGSQGLLYHSQDCCENVCIEDVNGNWDDLLNTPLLVSEERSNGEEGDLKGWEESYTWTFYTFRSVKGSVDVRWLGTSNGYYSESVSFSLTAPTVVPTARDCL